MENLTNNIVEQITKKIKCIPEVAIILGSGLKEIAENLTDKVELPYSKIKGMPQSNVQGHENKFVFGRMGGKNVVAMLGRFHFYSTGNAQLCGLPILIFKKLGVKTLIVTNSAGSVNKKIRQGDLVLITDHINYTGVNPLVNFNCNIGHQFVDMTNAYDKQYGKSIKEIAKKCNIEIKEGVYMQFSGPSYETKTEVKMANILGADVVGMSTALEVIVANKCEMKVLGLSCVSNMGAGLAKTQLNHNEVIELGNRSQKKLTKLIENFVETL